MTLAIHYSRNHMKPKRGKIPRPKFHCIMLTSEITDHEEYKRLAKLAHKVFPYFDTRAEDAAHFFFGTPDAQVEFYPGTITLNECLEMYYPDAEDDSFWELDTPYTGTIPEGSRNNTMSHFAGRVLKRFGDTDEAYRAFLKRAARCEPPLDDEELKTIWRSAQSFYQRISTEEDYVPPEEWNAGHSSSFKYDPSDRTDVGQARLLGAHFGQELRYSPATDYIRYDGSCWQETKPGAQAVAHALTDKQLEEAEAAVAEAVAELNANGGWELVVKYGKKKAADIMNGEQLDSFMAYQAAESYRMTAIAVLSEIGGDMSVFPTAKNLCSWAGCCPRNDQSGAKVKSTRISRAGSYLKPLLVQVANALIHSRKHPEFAERYRRIKARRGHKKAIIAVCKMLLTAIWNILSKLVPYSPAGFLSTSHDLPPSKSLTVAQGLSLLRRRGFILTDDPLSAP